MQLCSIHFHFFFFSPPHFSRIGVDILRAISSTLVPLPFKEKLVVSPRFTPVTPFAVFFRENILLPLCIEGARPPVGF